MSNDFLPFATAGGANVMTQVDYAALAARATGFQPGLAESAKFNKVFRQASAMAAAIGAMISASGGNANDDGNITALMNAFIEALKTIGGRTGDMKFSLNGTADVGWIIINDGTIGSAASGATTRANADTQALYSVFWNNFSDAFAPVTSGRGANAAADFAANKPIRTGIVAGRILGATGSGTVAGVLTPRIPGDVTGEEAVVLVPLNIAAHRHLNGIANDTNSGNDAFVYDATIIDIPGNSTQGLVEGGGNTRQGTTSSIVDNASGTVIPPRTSAATAHDNMQPTTFFNLMVKL